ncbi:PepSY domain-containing protein [Prosthecomicrobium sp. N25]|uniref:PepSY domain-containing protein n=1 Tax=Prosthecomicrobium sp. N25 TaxID=3129254 RepID=UPI003076C3DF
MFRRMHSLPGIAFAVVLSVTAMTGAILSVEPVIDRLSSPSLPTTASVADLAAAVSTRHQTVERITVRPTGIVTVAYTDPEEAGIERVDPATGASLGPYQASGFFRFVTELHRSFLFGDAGRMAAGATAFVMLAMSVSGLALLVRALGGWRGLFGAARGPVPQRWHVKVGRLAVAGLTVTSLTGLWMTADTFGFVPAPSAPQSAAPASGGAPAPVETLEALRAIPLATLERLDFPAADDPSDVFTVKTGAGEVVVDPATGLSLGFAPASLLDRAQSVIRMLHTGRGLWALGLILGLSAAAVPVLAATGLAAWWRRRSGSAAAVPVPAGRPDTVVLVGSEGNATWGFAETLRSALARSGHVVHVAAMNAVGPEHLDAERLLILTSTYGDGDPPASASRFLARLDRLEGAVPYAVLGFGDRRFPQFCGYASAVSAAMEAKGWPCLMALKRVDRQSAQEFAQWGHDLGQVLGNPLGLEHVATTPATSALELVDREDYGKAVGAPVCILRFRAPSGGARPGRLPAFEAGDLVGIVPPGSGMPRFYSLASSTRDGVLEICVRLREGGLCSTFLHGLTPGDRVEAFIRDNPGFRPAVGSAPLILIGAGAGIGPLAGFVRANRPGRPVHLYWGGRSPASDFLYEHELAQHLAERRLTSLVTAFSRGPGSPAYIQDRIRADAPRLRELIRHGGQVLVCGGRDMAQAVTQALETVVRPLGLDLATLKSTGRYVEDVY